MWKVRDNVSVRLLGCADFWLGATARAGTLTKRPVLRRRAEVAGREVLVRLLYASVRGVHRHRVAARDVISLEAVPGPELAGQEPDRFFVQSELW